MPLYVILDGFTKSAHFIPVKSTYSTEDYASILINNVMCHYGIPLSIISYRGAQFTTRFLRSFKEW